MHNTRLIMGCVALGLSTAMPATTSHAQADAEATRKGVALAKQGDYTGAAAEFSKAVKANPKNENNYSNRGKAYRAAGKFTEAEDDFTKVIEMDSENAEAYSERGKARVSQKEYAEAIEDLSKAIELDDAVDSRRFLAFAYLSKGDHDKAIEEYSALIEKAPNDVEAHRRRGYAYASKGDTEKAKEDFEMVLKAKPNDEDAATRLKALNRKGTGSAASPAAEAKPAGG